MNGHNIGKKINVEHNDVVVFGHAVIMRVNIPGSRAQLGADRQVDRFGSIHLADGEGAGPISQRVSQEMHADESVSYAELRCYIEVFRNIFCNLFRTTVIPIYFLNRSPQSEDNRNISRTTVYRNIYEYFELRSPQFISIPIVHPQLFIPVIYTPIVHRCNFYPNRVLTELLDFR